MGFTGRHGWNRVECDAHGVGVRRCPGFLWLTLLDKTFCFTLLVELPQGSFVESLVELLQFHLVLPIDSLEFIFIRLSCATGDDTGIRGRRYEEGATSVNET